MTTGRLRVGITGAGWVAGARHLPTLLERPDVEVVSIHDPDVSRAERLTEQARAAGSVSVSATDDLDAFLAERLDVVHVTASPWAHHDLAVAALRAGAHVFTEKPMAMHLDEAQQMVDEARRAERLICVSHNFLWSHAMQRAHRLLRDAPVEYVLGLQLSAHTRRLPSWYQDLPGGLMFDEVPHMLYTLADLLGGSLELDHVRARLDEDGQPRQVEVLVNGRNGPGQVSMVFSAAVSEWHVLASSAVATVGIDLFRDIAIGVAPDGRHGAQDIARTSMTALGGHVAGFVQAGIRLVRKRQRWGHDELIGAFLDAVSAGGASPVPVERALEIVSLTDGVIERINRR